MATFHTVRRARGSWLERHFRLTMLLLIVMSGCAWATSLRAQTPGTAFVYQGQLVTNGALVSGTCNFAFSLFDSPSGGTQVGATLTRNGVVVSSGLFAVALDFGASAFTGAPRWLAIAAQCAGDAALTPLAPRQQLTPTPYAIFAASANSANSAATAGSANTANTATNAQSVPWSGVTGKPAWAQTELPAWQLLGNTAAPGAFVGTTNTQPLELRVNNTPGLRLVYGQDTNADADTAVTPHLLGGDLSNQAPDTNEGGVIGGGSQNTLGDSYAVIGGGTQNHAALFGVVAGGSGNTITDSSYGVIGGGLNNRLVLSTSGAQNFNTIGGGLQNEINGAMSTIAGGDKNAIVGNWSAIGGGNDNSVVGSFGAIAGGSSNLISANFATVSGVSNQALADYTTIPGGTDARATQYGQLAYASGSFGPAGDAQASLYVLRGNTNNNSALATLDGSSTHLSVPAGRAMAIDVMVVAKATGSNNAAAYHYTGLLRYSGGVSPVLQVRPANADPTADIPPIFEDIAGWKTTITPFLGAILIQIDSTGTSGTVQWVVTIRATEVGPP